MIIFKKTCSPFQMPPKNVSHYLYKGNKQYFYLCITVNLVYLYVSCIKRSEVCIFQTPICNAEFVRSKKTVKQYKLYFFRCCDIDLPSAFWKQTGEPYTNLILLKFDKKITEHFFFTKQKLVVQRCNKDLSTIKPPTVILRKSTESQILTVKQEICSIFRKITEPIFSAVVN